MTPMKKCGLYLHIPFCRQKCFYCDFVSYAGRSEWMKPYVEALRKEITDRGSLMSSGDNPWQAASVYFGGGTPTALPAADLAGLVSLVKDAFLLEEKAEITIEANPGTVSRDYLTRLREAGANRLSFGVQSFDDRLLKNIGRIHTAGQAYYALDWAREAGFDNISIDLMYGLPGQSLADLKGSVEAALAVTPKISHISVYGLTIEEGTPFQQMQCAGRFTGELTLPDEDEAGDMYDYLTEELPRRGYGRYEISNYALPGRESRHNLGYWQDVPYLGMGAGAHSYGPWDVGGEYGCRFSGTGRLEPYILGRDEVRYDLLSREESMEEFCFLALRTAAGISREKFQQKYSVELGEIFGGVIEKLEAQGLLAADGEGVRLTKRGMQYGNAVFREFLPG